MNSLKPLTQKVQQTPQHWLTLEDCVRIFKNFKKALESMGEPIPEFETRFPGKLEGILESVRQTWNGEYLNPTILDAAAAYINQFIRGHPFRNGNKRMAVLFTHYFLLAHNVDYTLSYNELFFFAITVAKAGEEDISAEQTRSWCREILEHFTEDAK